MKIRQECFHKFSINLMMQITESFRPGADKNKLFGVVIDLPERFSYDTKKEYVSPELYDSIRNFAEKSQEPLIKEIENLGAEITHRLWRANQIGANLTAEQLIKVSESRHVEKIRLAVRMKVLSDQAMPLSKVTNVWSQNYYGTGQHIAILDSGVEQNHSDLVNRVTIVKNYIKNESIDDYYGHGTHVAGIVAGNGSLYKGAANKSQILIFKIVTKNGTCDELDLRTAMDDAVTYGINNNIKIIINISVGFPKICDGTCSVCKDADFAVQRGGILIVAAGNKGPANYTINCPASAEKVISVGAITNRSGPSGGPDNIAWYSSRGPTADSRIKPDIVAYGGDKDDNYQSTNKEHENISLISCKKDPCQMDTNAWLIDKNYFGYSGTSMACALVSGVCALLLEKNSNLDHYKLKSILAQTAQPITNLLPEDCGSGKVNAEEAMKIA